MVQGVGVKELRGAARAIIKGSTDIEGFINRDGI